MTKNIREPSFQAVTDVMTQRQAAYFRYGSNRRLVLVDLFTASAIATCHAALSNANKAKLERMCAASAGQFKKVAAVCLRNVS